MREHKDERRTAWCDIYPGLVGDLNVFRLRGRRPSGWHRHRQQVDSFFVADGEITFGYWNDGQNPRYATLYPGDEIKITPGAWHGYEAQTFSAVLVMYLSHKYDPADEEKMSFEEVPWAPAT